MLILINFKYWYMFILQYFKLHYWFILANACELGNKYQKKDFHN